MKKIMVTLSIVSSILGIALIIAGFALFFSNNKATHFVTVYISDYYENEINVSEMKSNFNQIEGVKDVEYISNEQALEKEKESLGDNANAILGSYTETNHPFPASFKLNLEKNADLDLVKSKVRESKYSTYLKKDLYGTIIVNYSGERYKIQK